MMRVRSRFSFASVVPFIFLLVSRSGPMATANPSTPTYTIIDLGTLGDPLGSDAVSVNARGQVVGYSAAPPTAKPTPSCGRRARACRTSAPSAVNPATLKGSTREVRLWAIATRPQPRSMPFSGTRERACRIWVSVSMDDAIPRVST
jgi:hypothetical protein